MIIIKDEMKNFYSFTCVPILSPKLVKIFLLIFMLKIFLFSKLKKYEI